MQLLVLSVSRSQACSFLRVIPEIDIWRAAELMLKRYRERASEESTARAGELAAGGDRDGATTGVGLPTPSCSSRNNTPPPGPLH
jgi:hypothetical protein